MLRRVAGISWSDKVTNAKLYKLCDIKPASMQALEARWRLFGHTLRMNPDTPARQAMAYYFVKDHPGRKGNRVTIASALSKEYKAVFGEAIDTKDAYEDVVQLAQDRENWKDIVAKVVQTQSKAKEDKTKRKDVKRKAAKRLNVIKSPKRRRPQKKNVAKKKPIKKSRQSNSS